jgi:hypothetical protein
MRGQPVEYALEFRNFVVDAVLKPIVGATRLQSRKRRPEKFRHKSWGFSSLTVSDLGEKLCAA